MKVLLALSGGVDSAVCARLLQNDGHDVHGLVIRFSPAHQSAVEAAQTAAGELGIPLHVAGCEAEFDRLVVTPFCNDYAAGRTPNPCVICNPTVKFNVLLREADRLGMDRIATGHYARLARRGGLHYVRTAQNAARDQSYMLYRLPQAVLGRLMLPAGELDKQTIRVFAESFGLTCADAPDSQEICFIPDGDYAAWLKARGVSGLSGRFIGPAGEDLGPHKGVEHYTVGQRKGLGLALGQPAFVRAIRPGGDIEIVHEDGTWAAAVTISDIRTADGAPLPPGECRVKIRSMARPELCTVAPMQGGAAITFARPLRSPAPGQHAVLYREDLVLGGGAIDTVTYALPPATR